MDHSQFLAFLENACTLTNEQVTLLKTALEDRKPSSVGKSKLMSRIEHNFDNNPLCPHCQSCSVNRWGHHNGRQRYRCNQCLKTFNAFTGTPLKRLRIVGALDRYVNCMTSSMTLRPAARECGISLDASFRLRHRLMQVVDKDKASQLEGIVEMDETFFRHSLKGERHLPRAARKRGGVKTRFVSGKDGRRHRPKRVPVWVACDRQGHITDAVLKHVSADELFSHLENKIAPDTPLVADSHLAHEKVAERLNVVLKELLSYSGKRVIEKVFHIQHVNAYHSTLKTWINGTFRGVASKYMYRYLGWRRLLSGNLLTKHLFMEKIAGHWVTNT